MGTGSIRSAAWYHGTKYSRFSSWQVPPPRTQDVHHTGIFFTKDIDAAREAGPNVCVVHLTDHARILDATAVSAASMIFRQAVNLSDMARLCLHTRTDQAWTGAWRTGEVLRFASDDPQIMRRLMDDAAQLKGYSAADKLAIAQHNWTRNWIEHIVTSAAKLGFNTLHGFEIDRHGDGKPRAVSWLAVTDAKAVTAPSWL